MMPQETDAAWLYRKLELSLSIPPFMRRELQAMVETSVARIRAEEREACATLAENAAWNARRKDGVSPADPAALEIARAIRARR